MRRFYLLFAGLVFMCGSQARAADVTLKNVQIKRGDETIRFLSITLVDTNATEKQAQAFASGTASEAERTSFLRNLSASKLLAPEADDTFSGNDSQGTRIVKFFGLEADSLVRGVAAEARFEKGSYWSVAKDGRSSVVAELRSAEFHNVDFSEFAAPAGGLMIAAMQSKGLSAKIFLQPPKGSAVDGPLSLDVGDLDTHTRYADEAPVESTFSLRGAVLTFPSGSAAERNIASFGYPELKIKSSGSSVYDAKTKIFQFKELRVDVENVGSVVLSGRLGEVKPDFFMGPQDERMGALRSSDLLNLKVRIEDSGLMDKILGFYSARYRLSPDKLRKGWGALVLIAGPKFLHGDPAGDVLASALSEFIQTGRPLNLTIEPANGSAVPFADLLPPYAPNLRSELRIDAMVDKPAGGGARAQ